MTGRRAQAKLRAGMLRRRSFRVSEQERRVKHLSALRVSEKPTKGNADRVTQGEVWFAHAATPQ